ncbi:asparagine synthase (glutamine-hydrolyzing) [Streptomyces sp. V1I6]|uniref:asparagine synthase (glutamine-hydrolyzing) n=1 Tax=Streptomyces sp. V1I6 TaxID=3042273 RepID=UPI00278AAECF|nr:asparagine synthase (glutamine-hydrolyzing) [Streptomyces sp. V1I6]MDQ0841400.1 asparagine synthase (glutamine-hydrolyzing) [Streptomyces sp. V1I6]
MCGITGWISFDRRLNQESTTLDRMVRTLTSRGPDAGGTWIDGHAALGHRRLAVIDLVGGTQPMQAETPDGRVALTYSGEVYNFTELRDELRRRGHHFRTASDTEVVLNAYLEWGEAMASRLNGMFAFAVWDSRTQKLVMIRDRMGIKPLFFYPTADGVLFGSEPKAIFANPLAKPVVSARGLREFIAFSRPPGETIWDCVEEVVPGTVITVDRSGIRRHTYWRLETVEHVDDLETTVGRVNEILDDTVARQLVADVPTCVLLSGGLDSSAITALAAGRRAAQGDPLHTFAIDFAGESARFVANQVHGSRDAEYASEMARHAGSEHADIVLSPTALADPDVRRQVVIARDSPAGLGDMDVSLYLLFKAIRERSTVALSGEAADEVFGGYGWLHNPVVQEREMFPWITAGMIGASPNTQPAEMYNLDMLIAVNPLEAVADGYATAVAEVGHLETDSAHEKRMRVLSYLHLTRFLRMMLDRKDRMSMAVGLEVRVPFSDHRLVEYVYNTPWSMKTYDGREKSLLRGATRDLLPQSVTERVKSPYPVTQDRSYGEALQQQAKQMLGEDGPVFEIVSRDWLTESAATAPDELALATRNGIERALDTAIWLDEYRPEIRL